MIKGLRYYIKRSRQRKLLEAAGVNERDVFVASFPKSGNTWMRFILARALYGHKEIDQTTIRRYFPTVHTSSADELRNAPAPRYIKTHHTFFELYPRCIYLYRDYRAVVVSGWFHAKKNAHYTGTLAEFIDSKLLYAFGPWFWHVNTALDWKKKNPQRIHLVRYEDLLSDTHQSVADLIRFTGIEPVISIDEIVSATRFSKLQQMEKATQPGDHLFFRSGQSDSWKEYLTPDLEQKLLNTETRETMLRCGYLK